MFKQKYSTKEIFEELPINKSLFVLALPAIIGQLITLIYNIADTFFIGQVNNPLMITATSLAFPIFAMTAPVSIITGTGAGTLISRLMGVHQDDEARRVSAYSICVNIALGLLYSLLIFAFLEPLIKFLGAEKGTETFLYTKQYMTWVVVLGGLPTIVTNSMANMLRSVGHSKEAGFGVAFGGVMNIVLDPIFMFVLLPDGMEVVGAGVATMISNCASALYFAIKIFTLQKSTPLNYSFKYGLPSKANMLKVFAVGLPSATTTLLFDINNMLLNKLMSAYGDIAVAAIGMTVKLERFSLNTCIGICLGMTPLVAYNYSCRNYTRMKDYVNTTRRWGIIISLISIALYEIFAVPFVRIFIKDAATVALGAAFLRRRAIASIFMFLNFYMVHFFQGIGSGKHTFWLSVIRYAFLCIPALYVMNTCFGMYGLPMAQTVGDSISAAICAVIYIRYLKKNIDCGE